MSGKPTYKELEQRVKDLEKIAIERKKGEIAVKDSLEEKETLLNSLVEHVVYQDTEMRVLWANRAACESVNLTRDQILGRFCYEIWPQRSDPCPACPLKKSMKTGQPEEVEKYTSDGRAWFIRGYPARDATGNIVGAFELTLDFSELKKAEKMIRKAHDKLEQRVKERTAELVVANKKLERQIKERKQAEESLRESERKYRTLLETASEGCWMLNPELKTIEVNESLCKMLGYSPDEMLGKTPFDFTDDENRKIFIEQTSKISATDHRSYEITLKKKNGQDLHAYFNASTIRDESGELQGSFAFVTDISERKRAGEERNRLAAAIEQSAESVFITDRNGTIQYINPAFERVTGYSRKDAIGQNSRILKSGKQDALFYKQMWDTLNRGNVWKGRFVNRKKNGSLYEADATITPVLDKSGNIINFVSIKRDVTHETELEKHLIQAQKMEAVGILAGGVAHDFNNILTTIIGNASLMLMDVARDSALREEIEEIKIAGERGASLTRQLLAFSRKQIIRTKILDLNKLLTGIKKMLRRLIGEDIELVIIPEPSLWRVEVDPGQFDQVIMNLAVNAKDAMPMGGKLIVKTANVHLDGDFFKGYDVEEHAGPYVLLSLSDTGSGMDKKTQERIFEPFFTTKESGRGTGLGLSTVYGIVKQSNGFIWTYSEPGQGTIFKVYLPKAKGGKKPVEKDQCPIEAFSGSETVLLVEDDDRLRNLAHKILRQCGYRVLMAENGEDALRVRAPHEGAIDLLLTDVVMPKMGGKETAERLQALYPHMKVIYMSGYTDDTIVHHGVLAPELNFLEKPFTPEGLVRRVREVLDKKQE
jgi:two-component system, cell cycle sensor histidine kinase and response regulator CckA